MAESTKLPPVLVLKWLARGLLGAEDMGSPSINDEFFFHLYSLLKEERREGKARGSKAKK